MLNLICVRLFYHINTLPFKFRPSSPLLSVKHRRPIIIRHVWCNAPPARPPDARWLSVVVISSISLPFLVFLLYNL